MFIEFLEDTKASASVEYGLLSAFIGVGLIAAFTELGIEIEAIFRRVSDALANATRHL